MGRRIRNLFIAVGMSLALWAMIIQGSVSLYHLAKPHTDEMMTASIK